MLQICLGSLCRKQNTDENRQRSDTEKSDSAEKYLKGKSGTISYTVDLKVDTKRPDKLKNTTITYTDGTEEDPLQQDHESIQYSQTDRVLGLVPKKTSIYDIPDFEPEAITDLAGIRSEIDRIRVHFLRYAIGKRIVEKSNHIVAFMFETIEGRLKENDAREALKNAGYTGWREVIGGMFGGLAQSLFTFGTQTGVDHAMTNSRNTAGYSFLPGGMAFGALFGAGESTARAIAKLLTGKQWLEPVPIRIGGSHNLGQAVNEFRDLYGPSTVIYTAAYFLAGYLDAFNGQSSFGTGVYDRDNRGTDLARWRVAVSTIAGGLTGMVSSLMQDFVARAQITRLYRTGEDGRSTIDMAWAKEMVLALNYRDLSTSETCKGLTLAIFNSYCSLPPTLLAKEAKGLLVSEPTSSVEKGYNGSLGMLAFLAGWSFLQGGKNMLVRYQASKNCEDQFDQLQYVFDHRHVDWAEKVRSLTETQLKSGKHTSVGNDDPNVQIVYDDAPPRPEPVREQQPKGPVLTDEPQKNGPLHSENQKNDPVGFDEKDDEQTTETTHQAFINQAFTNLVEMFQNAPRGTGTLEPLENDFNPQLLDPDELDKGEQINLPPLSLTNSLDHYLAQPGPDIAYNIQNRKDRERYEMSEQKLDIEPTNVTAGGQHEEKDPDNGSAPVLKRAPSLNLQREDMKSQESESLLTIKEEQVDEDEQAEEDEVETPRPPEDSGSIKFGLTLDVLD